MRNERGESSTISSLFYLLRYRFLDCAEFYGNEAEVGLAIEDSKLPRADLFLASKVISVGSMNASIFKNLKTDSSS